METNAEYQAPDSPTEKPTSTALEAAQSLLGQFYRDFQEKITREFDQIRADVSYAIRYRDERIKELTAERDRLLEELRSGQRQRPTAITESGAEVPSRTTHEAPPLARRCSICGIPLTLQSWKAKDGDDLCRTCYESMTSQSL